jgi:uncharacterized transporter YbjL
MNAMEDTIKSIYSSWNAGDLSGVLTAFAALGPKGYTIEYVGEAPLEGVAAVQDMWNNYAGTCTTDIVQLIVNGNEAAALIHNNVKTDDGVMTLPSIETYHVNDGVLAVRYFHQTPPGS